MADNKLIAKNTIFLYIRMMIIIVISFYTSRVVLDKLGVDDYGIFNAVAGVIGMLGFLNNTLANGTSRFLTFELGNGYNENLKRTFSTAFFSHIILMLIMFLILETLGIWFLNNKLIILPERIWATHWVYQISLLSMCISIIQVPYTSSIIAHEDMSLYAYLSIGEAIGKLLIVYILSVSLYDKMVLYAILLVIFQLFIFIVYYIFCKLKYEETDLHLIFDKTIFKNMLVFSGWNIIANLTETLKLQGANILISMFFKPSLVAAQAITNQVTSAVLNFVCQFTTAINPQIIKSYAVGNLKDSQKLTLLSTIFVFDLVLLLCLPLILIIEPILNIWLVEVPEYTIKFIRIALIIQIVGVFNITFYTPMLASGNLRTNSIWGLYLGIGQFFIVYFLYKMGFDVLWLQYILLFSTIIYSFYIKPIILYKEIGYDIKAIIICYLSCFKVLIPSVLISCGIYYLVTPKMILEYIIILFSTVITVLFCSFIFMDKDLRSRVLVVIKSRIACKK